MSDAEDTLGIVREHRCRLEHRLNKALDERDGARKFAERCVRQLEQEFGEGHRNIPKIPWRGER